MPFLGARRNLRNFPANSLRPGKSQQNRSAPFGRLRRGSMLLGKSGKRCVSVYRCRLQDPENTREFTRKMQTRNETGLGGGGGGIRTHGTLSRTPVFKTGAFDHSATPPTRILYTANSDSERWLVWKSAEPIPADFSCRAQDVRMPMRGKAHGVK